MKRMKTKKNNLTVFFLLLLPLGVVWLGTGCEKQKLVTEEYVLIENTNAKVFKFFRRFDENNQLKFYDWAISTTSAFLDTVYTPLDDNILAPLNLSDEFKIEGLKIKVSGKKYIHLNRALSIPFERGGYGYVFEITAIEKFK